MLVQRKYQRKTPPRGSTTPRSSVTAGQVPLFAPRTARGAPAPPARPLLFPPHSASHKAGYGTRQTAYDERQMTSARLRLPGHSRWPWSRRGRAVAVGVAVSSYPACGSPSEKRSAGVVQAERAPPAGGRTAEPALPGAYERGVVEPPAAPFFAYFLWASKESTTTPERFQFRQASWKRKNGLEAMAVAAPWP